MMYEINHVSSLIHSSREYCNPQMISSQLQWLSSSIDYSVAPESRGHGFKPRSSPAFFRLLCAIVKIAFMTARIIDSIGYFFLISLYEQLENAKLTWSAEIFLNKIVHFMLNSDKRKRHFFFPQGHKNGHCDVIQNA